MVLQFCAVYLLLANDTNVSYFDDFNHYDEKRRSIENEEPDASKTSESRPLRIWTNGKFKEHLTRSVTFN